MKQTNFKLQVVKTREYVWRTYNFGSDASHNYIDVWWVLKVDDDGTEEVMAGGYTQGSNTKSGMAMIPRRRDAMAWARGFMVGIEADESDLRLNDFPLYLGKNPYRATSESVGRVFQPGNRLVNYFGRKYDGEEAESFQAGADHAAAMRSARPPRKTPTFEGPARSRYDVRPLKPSEIA